MIDNRSDLDCSATSTTVFISALGTQPLGSYIIATGFGASYNQFQQGIEIGSFVGSAGVAATTSTTFVASAVSQGRATVLAVSSSSETYYSLPPDSPDLAGSTDITHFGAFTAAHTYLVGFDASNHLVVQKYTVTSHSQSWGDARLIPSPEGEFVHSPTVCHTRTTSGFPARHLVAATDTGIWYSVAEESTDDFSGWELMNDVAATSAPDCVALEDGTVHAVVLTASGVTDIHGTSGDFTLTDLGTY